MKKIVYFIGAGFSVPAGLPVIANFLFRARNQFSSAPDKYSYFNGVFNYIDNLSKAKNFINVDLFNIEEVFSIADTHELLGKGLKKDLQQFIKDVILFYSPQFKPNPVPFSPSKHSFNMMLGSDQVSQWYVGFVAAILNLDFIEKKSNNNKSYNYGDIVAKKRNNIDAEYKIVSLNYDNLIENSISFINKQFEGSFSIPLAKLHGTVDGTIVPPTWNKSINGEINTEWRDAAKWLSEANEIRILGYSFPQTDIYIKHLWSTALVESTNLQKIDVICLDRDGTVEKRYRKIFNFPRFDFYNLDLTKYISAFLNCGASLNPYKTNCKSAEMFHQNLLK
jgi:hypothetical protein